MWYSTRFESMRAGKTLNVHSAAKPGPVDVVTAHPVAEESPDHLMPWGTARDSSRNRAFNAKLYGLFGDRRPLCVLDLGCSGGGFVRDCIDDGCFAVGIEGSDYSKRTARAEWATLADRSLFTADITKPFEVVVGGEHGMSKQKFDVITAWEVLEHIADDDLAALAENVRSHLRSDGLFIASVSPFEEVIDGVELHQTVADRPWWVARMAREGLENIDAYERYFNGQYVRGPRQGAPGSFHLFLSTDRGSAPRLRNLTLRERLIDRWIGSRGYHAARRLLGVST